MSEKNAWFKLSKNSIYCLLGVFVALLILSLLLSIATLINIARENPLKIAVFEQAIWGGISMAVLGSSIFYFRKLYKACINLDISIPNNQEDQIRQIGVFIYFILRPFFSIAFALIICFTLKESINIMVHSNELLEGFVFAAMTLCFFGGYSSGDLVDFLESASKKAVEHFFEHAKI